MSLRLYRAYKARPRRLYMVLFIFIALLQRFYGAVTAIIVLSRRFYHFRLRLLDKDEQNGINV
jgi:hypothetical protein